MLVLATVIGGRIVPAFTSSGLKARGDATALRTWRWIAPAVIALMAAVAIADAVRPDGAVAGWIAAAAALAQALRLLQWRTPRTLRMPIVWVLHLAYAWLAVGLGLKALALLDGAGVAAFWLHALDHRRAGDDDPGRDDARHARSHRAADRGARADRGRLPVLAGAAVVRVFGLLWWRQSYPAVIVVSALLWTAAFAVFVAVFAPMLWSPRVDGRPG